jgi:hypothetical protein
MSESTDDRVNKLDQQLNYIRGVLDKTLPNLPTKQDLELALLKHKDTCDVRPPEKKGRIIKIALPTGFGAAIGAAVARLFGG